MNRFFRKLERFFVNLLLITLIVIISFQIIMRDESTYQHIKKLEYTVKGLLNTGNTVEVTSIKEMERKAYLTIDLLHDYSLPQVYLVQNGLRVADFSDGVVRIEVNSGDLISIDATLLKKTLWFEITSLSASISNLKPGQQFRVSGDIKSLGVIEFYNKI